MKMLPQSPESEQAIIGGVLSGSFNGECENCLSELTEDHFLDRPCRLTWKKIKELHKEGKPLGLISVTNELTRSGDLNEVGGNYWISKVGSVFSTDARYHISELKDKFKLRRILELSSEYSKKVNDGETADSIINAFNEKLFDLGSSEFSNGNRIASASEALRLMIEKRINKEKIDGLLSGISSWDYITGGFQRSQLYILGGRISSGKTAFADQTACNLIKRDIPFLYICLESSEERILAKIACKLAEVSYHSFLHGFLQEKDLRKIDGARKNVESSRMVMIRPNDITGSEIRSLIRREKNVNSIELVIMDYLQKVKIPEKWDERRAVSDASMQIQRACVETGVPALILVQLNRESEKEARPKMRHLKESSQIEQDADFIGILFSDVDKETLEKGADLPVTMGVEKNKDGPSHVDLKFDFNGTLMKFKERKV